jgi:hypothetical protein
MIVYPFSYFKKTSLCPSEIIITRYSSTLFYSGTYYRWTSYSGGSFDSVYLIYSGGPYSLNYTTAPDGRKYASYRAVVGSATSTYIRAFDTSGNKIGWFTLYISGGTTSIGPTTSLSEAFNSDIFDGTTYFPAIGRIGFSINPNINYYDVDYPFICPPLSP